MSIEWFRDLVIIISGLLLIGTLILFSVISYLLYRRVNRILVSMEIVSARLRELCDLMSEIAKPLLSIANFFFGLRKGVENIGNIFRGRKEK
ncbi:MAG: hypothetical protein HY665_00960 [Chloroflexi bacterium]|nr:hypothetical protein [Chloroflexota bacterium]